MWTPRWWKVRKAKKHTEIVARGLVELHYLAITAHGRYQLQWIVDNVEDDEVPDIILGLYRFFLQHAPVSDYAVRN